MAQYGTRFAIALMRKDCTATARPTGLVIHDSTLHFEPLPRRGLFYAIRQSTARIDAAGADPMRSFVNGGKFGCRHRFFEQVGMPGEITVAATDG
jgi:hypothetical protein